MTDPFIPPIHPPSFYGEDILSRADAAHQRFVRANAQTDAVAGQFISDPSQKVAVQSSESVATAASVGVIPSIPPSDSSGAGAPNDPSAGFPDLSVYDLSGSEIHEGANSVIIGTSDSVAWYEHQICDTGLPKTAFILMTEPQDVE